MAFQYLDRPGQLWYDDSGSPIFLPYWINSLEDIRVAERMIRQKRWGSIPYDKFRIRVWNNYGNVTEGDPFDFTLINATGYAVGIGAGLLERNFAGA